MTAMTPERTRALAARKKVAESVKALTSNIDKLSDTFERAVMAFGVPIPPDLPKSDYSKWSDGAEKTMTSIEKALPDLKKLVDEIGAVFTKAGNR